MESSMNRRLTAAKIGLAALLSACLFAAFPARESRGAALKGYIELCDKVMCPWHKVVFQPPKGWVEDESWTQRYKAVVLFPDGKNDRSKPMMYVRAHHGDADLALEP